MSDNQTMGFGKFVPGFDFLQNLAKGATQSLTQMPNLANWVAPTLNVEELEKRIGELKAVHFWLDQNSKALGATIQALEVQKMTLATLKGMNFAMEDITNALKLRTADAMMGGLKKGAGGAAVGAGGSGSPGDTATDAAGAAGAAGADAPESDITASTGGGSRTAAKSKPGSPAAKKADVSPAANVIDPMQWWGSLTQQFQQIAATAMKDVGAQTAMHTARKMTGGASKEALKSATGAASGAATGKTKAAAKKAPAKRARKKGSA